MIYPDDSREEALAARGYRWIAGVDEAGRGCLAGPVVASAVILGEWRHPRINDSKKLTPKMREFLYDEIMAHALAVGVGMVGEEEIDRINILEASRLAMQIAVLQLKPGPDALLLDAIQIEHPAHQVSLVHGDAVSISIAAASIIAKVTRDRLMPALDQACPGYDFTIHKGYGTARHLEALTRLGPCRFHRKTFTPVRNLLQ
ncbi:MAG TPA: ribonuclease HII [Spirochaetota bacterium]|nr:ribonuclease HII [Spirochaetota bacterium]HPH01538.1 ribonuclease HII [Spirochaetota bacterium]